MPDYKIGDPLFVCSPYGWSHYDVTEYTVTKVTPKGQVVALSARGKEIRITAKCRIVGSDTWSRTHIVDAERAAQIRAELANYKQFQSIATLAEALGKRSRNEDLPGVEEALSEIAKAVTAILKAEGDGEAGGVK